MKFQSNGKQALKGQDKGKRVQLLIADVVCTNSEKYLICKEDDFP
ncbi:hypothetical protein U9M49_04525 [Cytobacillus sp. OWB-43]|nr:hypothetical protein [Cytobacillus sp. OWB-43]